jgi:CHAT domain-containing protein
MTRRGPFFKEIKVSEEELNTLVQQLRDAIKNKQDGYLSPAQKLYDYMLKPVADILDSVLGTSSNAVLMMAPDGALSLVPISVLHDGKHFVAEKWNIALFNDAVMQRLQVIPSRARQQSFGTTLPSGKNPGLEFVKVELNSIANLLPGGKPVLDADFTRERLDEAFQANRSKNNFSPIIHIATHFNIGIDEKSTFLVLGNGGLTLDEIRRLDLLNTELLTLSACDTAVGSGKNQSSAYEFDSFAQIAQAKGAHAVLATLWGVNDVSTSKFMSAFYKMKFASNEHFSKAKAIRLVQMKFIKGEFAPDKSNAKPGALNSWKHPFYWAPFVLLGNWL